VSTKQVVLAFGIEFLSSAPVLADARIPRPAQEPLEGRELIDVRAASLTEQIGNEPGEALALPGRFDPGLCGDLVRQRDRNVLHDTKSV
jgi:hypothetical protein